MPLMDGRAAHITDCQQPRPPLYIHNLAPGLPHTVRTMPPHRAPDWLAPCTTPSPEHITTLSQTLLSDNLAINTFATCLRCDGGGGGSISRHVQHTKRTVADIKF